MAKYKVQILIDDTAPFVFVDLGLADYVLELEVSCGGKVADFWQHDGQATLLLDNSGGEFNPHNTSSPFYGKLLTKRRVKVLLNGAIFWTGVIEGLTPTLNTKDPTATLELTQGVQNIKDTLLTGKVYQNKNGKEIVQSLLEENKFLPISATPVFILDYSELNDNLTVDPSAGITNKLSTEIVFPYASDTWDAEVSLYKALTDMLEVQQSYAMLNRAGEIILMPFYQMKIDALAGTENVDDNSIDSAFSSSDKIVNSAIVSFYERAVTLGDTAIEVTKDTTLGANLDVRIATLETEQKKVLLDNVLVGTGNEYVAVGGFDAKSVTLIGTQDGNDIPITITADTLTVNKKGSIRRDNTGSQSMYRYTYQETLDYKLAPSEVAAINIGDKALLRYAFPFTYVEYMNFVDYYPYEIGDTVLLTSVSLPAGGARHLIVGEKHTLKNDLMRTTYFMIGEDSASIFILDSSLLDGNHAIL